MRVIDEARLEMPYAGARKIRAELCRRTGGEVDVSRRCVAGLMEEMNVRPVYPKPNLSKPAKKAPRHPYLLKNKPIRFPNQVWSIDITYIPIGRTHMYLTCAIDWCSRLVVWRLADDVGAAGVRARGGRLRGARDALHPQLRLGVGARLRRLRGAAGVQPRAPEHGRQGALGRQRDRGEVAPQPQERVREDLRVRDAGRVRRLVAGYVEQHNGARPHQSLGYDTPSEWYYSGLAAA